MPMKVKMRMKAARVAIRAALGGDDMLSRWELKALQSRQKCGRVIKAATGLQRIKDMGQKLPSPGSSRDNREADESGRSATNSSEYAAGMLWWLWLLSRLFSRIIWKPS